MQNHASKKLSQLANTRTSTLAMVMAAGMVIGGCATGATAAWAERQPLMRTALGHLQAAETALQNATHDKGGHRAKALDHTRKAIRQTNKGIKHDNRN